MNRLVLILASIAHLVPHPFGVSSVGATALYAGAYGNKRYSWAIPMIPLLIGNTIFGFYDVRVLVFVYAGFALSTFAGRWLLSKERSYLRFGSAIAIGATIFFLVSNFAIWFVGMYPPTIAGLVQCYINGLPYLGQATIADAAFCFVLFGLHSWIERRQPDPVVA
ncbi:MAG: DUF6580 family putative transport protein [Woeseiaceae bacterium]